MGLDSDIVYSLNQFIQIVKEGRVDVICLPGDLYDRKSEPASRLVLASLLQELASVAPTFLVYGNHEVPKDLDLAPLLDSRWPISVYSQPGAVYIGDVRLHFLPWLTKSAWLAAHGDGLSKAESDRGVSRLALEYLRGQVDPNCKNILIAHLLIHGSQAQNHQPMLGEGITFGSNDLVDLGFYGGIFGHIHLKQEFANGRFFYNGAPAALNYGEEGEKFVSIFDTDSGEVEWHKLNAIDRYTVDCEWTNGTLQLLKWDNARAKGARVRVTGVLPDEIDLHIVREAIKESVERSGLLELKIELQRRPKEQLRSQAIVEAKTLEQKLVAFWESTGFPPDQETAYRLIAKLHQVEAEVRATEPVAKEAK